MACLALSACVSQTIKSTSVPNIDTPSSAMPQALLFDVSIVVFDPGFDNYDEDEQVYPEVRQAEAIFMPLVLSESIQNSGAWGAVRVVPDDTQVNDLIVRGEILHSDGEELQLAITAIDARGEVWLEETYTGKASRYAYQPATRNPYDPFQAVYNTIANDLLEQLEELPQKDRSDVRLITELRFARDFAPDAFNDYLAKARKGEYEIKRLPAENDPMLERVRDIRERNRLYVEALQDFYANFDGEISEPYQNWRKETFSQSIYLQEMRAESTRRLIVGGVAVLAGIAAASSGDSSVTRAAGQVAILGGGSLFKSGLDKRNESQFYAGQMEELSVAVDAAVAPNVIELEDNMFILTGNIEEQYTQWRALLGDIYRAEIGSLELPEESADTADTL